MRLYQKSKLDLNKVIKNLLNLVQKLNIYNSVTIPKPILEGILGSKDIHQF